MNKPSILKTINNKNNRNKTNVLKTINNNDNINNIDIKPKNMKYKIKTKNVVYYKNKEYKQPEYRISRNLRFKQVINIFKDYTIKNKTKYNNCLITRFDLLFKKNFKTSNIKLDKINIVSVLNKPNRICDNLYLFPYKHIDKFQELANNNIDTNYHYMRTKLNNIGPVNYILSENDHVKNLSFYKIVRNYIKK